MMMQSGLLGARLKTPLLALPQMSPIGLDLILLQACTNKLWDFVSNDSSQRTAYE